MTLELTPIPGPKVTVIEKNKSEEFRIQIQNFKGHKLLSCRVWYQSQDFWVKRGLVRAT